MDSILRLIKLIEQRPTMYIGRSSVFCLRAFIDGWFYRNPQSVVDDDIMGDFQEWIGDKYSLKSHSWDQIIAFYSMDIKDEIPVFFDHFNEFLKTVPKWGSLGNIS